MIKAHMLFKERGDDLDDVQDYLEAVDAAALSIYHAHRIFELSKVQYMFVEPADRVKL